MKENIAQFICKHDYASYNEKRKEKLEQNPRTQKTEKQTKSHNDNYNYNKTLTNKFLTDLSKRAVRSHSKEQLHKSKWERTVVTGEETV